MTAVYRYSDSPVLGIISYNDTHVLVKFETGDHLGQTRVIHKNSIRYRYR